MRTSDILISLREALKRRQTDAALRIDVAAIVERADNECEHESDLRSAVAELGDYYLSIHQNKIGLRIHDLLDKNPPQPEPSCASWTIRDLFASKALSARGAGSYESWLDLANDCYHLADAMLQARKQKPGTDGAK